MATLEQLRAERARRQQGGSSVGDRLRAERQRRQQQPETVQAGTFAAGLSQLSDMTRNPQVSRPDRPGILERVADNVIGLDNGYQSAGETAAAAMNKAGESMTLGIIGDEAAGRFDEAIGRRAPGTGVEFYREQERDLQANNPGLALAADVAPAFLPGAGAAKFVAAGATRGAQLGRSALAGAAATGTYAAAEAEGGIAERATSGATGAALGAVFGYAAPKVVGALEGVPRRLRGMFQRTTERPTVQALKSLKNAAYRAVDNAGEVFDSDTMTGLHQRVRDTLAADVSYVPGEDRAIDAALTMFERRAGQETTISQLDTMRKGLWNRVRANPDQVQLYDLIRAVDETIESRAGASDLMAAARAANSRYSKAELLENAFTRAADQAAGSGSGGNILNKYRQAVTMIINNPRKARFFSDAEIDTMRAFVRGDMPENVMRQIGKMSPGGNGLMMALQTFGAVSSGGATIPLMVAGAAAKQSADSRVQRGAEGLLDMVSGVQRPLPPAIRPQTAAVAVGGSGPAAEEAQKLRNALR